MKHKEWFTEELKEALKVIENIEFPVKVELDGVDYTITDIYYLQSSKKYRAEAYKYVGSIKVLIKNLDKRHKLASTLLNNMELKNVTEECTKKLEKAGFKKINDREYTNENYHIKCNGRDG